MNYVFMIIDSIIFGLLSLSFFSAFEISNAQIALITLSYILITVVILGFKQAYSIKELKLAYFYRIFEGIMVSAGILCIIAWIIGGNYLIYTSILFLNIIGFIAISLIRIFVKMIKLMFKRTKNVLIVGAGQDGKLIAEEIKKRPELKLNVVGFLDDNMNNIEDEDSSIKILGLTCDSEAVIKDNNVKIVIIAVKSRMDSDILTDLVKGIPLGVKVWRMYRFYEKITHKYLVSKMSVNWLFYDFDFNFFEFVF